MEVDHFIVDLPSYQVLPVVIGTQLGHRSGPIRFKVGSTSFWERFCRRCYPFTDVVRGGRHYLVIQRKENTPRITQMSLIDGKSVEFQQVEPCTHLS